MKGKFHCTIDRDACDPLAFIDPGIGVQFLGRGIARIVNFFERASARLAS